MTHQPNSDDTDDTTERRAMSVDLSDTEADPTPDPEPEPQPEGDGPIAAANSGPGNADAGDSEDLDPKTVARRLLQQADGPDDAIKGAQQALQTHLQEYREVKQRIDDRKGTISGLEETAKRVRDLPADALCLQTLSGGVTVEVSAGEADEGEYGREDLIGDIHDAIETHEDVIDDDKERLEELEAQCATIRQAAADLENLKELTDGEGVPSPGSAGGEGQAKVPDHERWPEH